MDKVRLDEHESAMTREVELSINKGFSIGVFLGGVIIVGLLLLNWWVTK